MSKRRSSATRAGPRPGKDDDGKVLEEARRKRAGELAALDRAMLPELRAVADMPPNLTFVDRLVLQRGERTIEIRWLGRGNTRGDTVVVLPKERIAASGDLVVYPVPFGILSYYDEWRDTLSKLDALPVDAFFPGHGSLMRDRAYLRQVQALVGALVDRVKVAIANGATVEETKAQVSLRTPSRSGVFPACRSSARVARRRGAVSAARLRRRLHRDVSWRSPRSVVDRLKKAGRSARRLHS